MSSPDSLVEFQTNPSSSHASELKIGYSKDITKLIVKIQLIDDTKDIASSPSATSTKDSEVPRKRSTCSDSDDSDITENDEVSS